MKKTKRILAAKRLEHVVNFKIVNEGRKMTTPDVREEAGDMLIRPLFIGSHVYTMSIDPNSLLGLILLADKNKQRREKETVVKTTISTRNYLSHRNNRM